MGSSYVIFLRRRFREIPAPAQRRLRRNKGRRFTSSALINRGGPVIKTPLQPFNSPAQNESYRASHKSRHRLFLSGGAGGEGARRLIRAGGKVSHLRNQTWRAGNECRAINNPAERRGSGPCGGEKLIREGKNRCAERVDLRHLLSPPKLVRESG